MSQSKSERPLPTTGPGDDAGSFAVEPEVFDKVLACYKPDCRYLRSALVERPAVQARAYDGDDTPVLSLLCEFSIPQSCYIDDTGHFNAVEFIICLNQMYYMGGAVGAVYGLVPALADMSFDEFLRRQLPDSLIHKLKSTFKRQINARAFSGRIAFPLIEKRSKFIVLETTCAYWDADGGYADGEVDYVIIDRGDGARGPADQEATGSS
jgi:hypothetical protein